MGDPLSIASGIAGLLGLSINIADSLFVYASTVRNAPKTIRTYLDEVNSLKAVLVQLDELVQRTGSLGVYSTTGSALAQANVANCRTELERINTELQKKRRNASALRNLIWPFAEHQVKKDIDMLRGYRSRFQTALSADAVAIGGTTLDEMRSLSMVIREGAADKHDKDILHWLCPSAGQDEMHQTVSARRMAGTGVWFIDKIETWLTGDPVVFWARGIPGAGKTILMSAVVDHAIANKDTHSFDAVAYIYFSYKEQNAQTTDSIFANIIAQIYLQVPQSRERVEKLYRKSSDGKQKPNIDSLTKLLADLSGSFKLFLAFDALDEAGEKTREVLVKQLASPQLASSRVFITSRPSVELKALGDNLLIEVVLAQDTDIETYAKARLNESEDVQDMLEGYADDVILEIVANIQSHALGMFLLVVFQMDFICQQTCAREMVEASQSMPSNPNDIYTQALERIDSQSKAQAILAHEVLGWLILAKRTLSLKELLEAIAIKPGTKALDPRNRRSGPLLVKCCRGLVVVDNDRLIRLAHLTVQEFLVEHLPEISSMCIHVAAACLTYISFDCFDTGPATSQCEYESRLSEHPFYLYACTWIGEHLRESEQEGEDHLSALLEFHSRYWPLMSCFQAQNCGDAVELAARDRGAAAELSRDDRDHSHDIRDSFLEAVALGSAPLIEALLARDCSILNQPGSFRRTPLAFAIICGHASVCKVLLDAGAVLDDYVRKHLKSFLDRPELRRGILENLMKGDTEQAINERNLFIAMATGNESWMTQLLKCDINVDATDPNGCTALHWACRFGFSNIASRLITAGANIEAADEDGRRPIQGACKAGDLEVVRLLLESGAGIEANDNREFRPIHEACKSGSLEIVQLLLDSGADIEAETQNRWRPMHIACLRGHPDIVRLLYQYGADMEARDIGHDRPIHWAILGGDEDIVKLLLEYGCNVNTRGDSWKTPLCYAIRDNKLSVAKLLIEHGADMNNRQLYGAMDFDKGVEMAELLLSNGWQPHRRFIRPGSRLEEYLQDNGHTIRDDA